MSTEEAIRIIDIATSNVAGTRADHEKIKEAIAVIKTKLEKK